MPTRFLHPPSAIGPREASPYRLQRPGKTSASPTVAGREVGSNKIIGLVGGPPDPNRVITTPKRGFCGLPVRDWTVAHKPLWGLMAHWTPFFPQGKLVASQNPGLCGRKSPLGILAFDEGRENVCVRSRNPKPPPAAGPPRPFRFGLFQPALDWWHFFIARPIGFLLHEAGNSETHGIETGV